MKTPETTSILITPSPFGIKVAVYSVLDNWLKFWIVPWGELEISVAEKLEDSEIVKERVRFESLIIVWPWDSSWAEILIVGGISSTSVTVTVTG